MRRLLVSLYAVALTLAYGVVQIATLPVL